MQGPLSSLKVLDFTTLLPGPFASLLLADLGAEVLRVESPTRPDLVRFLPPQVGRVSAVHAYLNRGKRSLALDLKQAEAVATVKRLVREYDIVLEQFRPGVMERLGLGYEALRAENPAIIYCSITGYGQNGPYRDRAGHDLNYLALAGVAGYGGRQGHGPSPQGVQVADLSGSLYAVAGLLAAVVKRQQTGAGDYVDVSMTDASFSLNALAASAMLAGGPAPGPESTTLNGGDVYDYYRTADGRWLAVGSLEPQFLAALLKALEREDLLPLAQSADPTDRRRLKQAVADALAAKDLAHWQAVFAATDACVEPVLTLDEAAEHPQLTARAMVVEVPGPDGAPLRQPGCALKFASGLPRPAFAGAEVGAHTEAVLAALEQSADS